MNFKKIPFEQIEIEPGFNTRNEYGEVQELKASIMGHGLEIPLIVIPASNGVKYWVKSGHRRWTAIDLGYQEKEKHPGFDFSAIPCDVRENYDPAKQVIDIIVHNMQKPLTPLEEAETYRRLVYEQQMSVHEISAITGKRKPHINSYLSLATAGGSIKELVRNDQLSASTAIQIISLHPGDEQAQLAEISGALDTAIEEGATRVRSSHVAKIKQKNPMVKFKMLQNKIAVEKLANPKCIHPAALEAIEIIGKLMADMQPQQAFTKLKTIK